MESNILDTWRNQMESNKSEWRNQMESNIFDTWRNQMESNKNEWRNQMESNILFLFSLLFDSI